MESNDGGKIDLGAVANLAAALAALAAVLTAAGVFREMREENQRARFSASVDSVWQMTEHWNSPAMLDIRSAAATGLLARKPTADVGAVIDFFAELTRFIKLGTLDEELAALEFYWPMVNYWSASQAYRDALRSDRPAAWDDVGAMVTRLAALRRRHATAARHPSDEQLREFLLDEQGQNECTDDSETHKTPL
jgi:hypothetical protein